MGTCKISAKAMVDGEVVCSAEFLSSVVDRGIDISTQIHPSAIIDKDAQIGENVSIGPFAIVEKDVIIGDGTEIKSSAVVRSGARIGKDCRIFQSSVIAEIPQDLKFDGEYSIFEIGDRTTIREFFVL